MWKDWLAFSRREQYGLVLLSLLIVLLVIVRFLLPFLADPPEIEVISDVKFLTESKYSVKMELKTKSSGSRGKKEFKFTTFNPNTVSVTELSKMGVPSYAIINWMKFREAGGVFRKGEEVGKIYGIDQELLTLMSPYVKIPVRGANERKEYVDIREKRNDRNPVVSGKTENASEIGALIIDLNKADTTELQKIKGIGPVFSQRIVDFRNLLGGFYSVEQLREVYGLSPGLVDEISAYFVVSVADIKKMDVNSFSLRKLKAHPYINFYQAREIIEYQRKNGSIANEHALEAFTSFDKAALEKVLPYLCFNEKNRNEEQKNEN
jgi:competence ComEA-like helix-hairpin-helix protein